MVCVANARHVLADVGPGGATVLTNLDVAVVSSDPQDARYLRRLSHGYDVAVSGITIVLGSHRVFAWHAHDRQCAAIDLFREIGCGRPGITTVHRSEQPVAADIHDARVVRRKMNRGAPVITIGFTGGWRRHHVRLETCTETLCSGKRSECIRSRRTFR